MLEVRLLGQFRIDLDGELIEIPSRPAQSLLAYLILHAGARHRRERLAGILWPESSETSARNNLRQALWRVRRSIRTDPATGEQFIAADKFNLGFNPESRYWLDVTELEREIPEDAPPEQWMEALAVYHGELLPGFYDDWVSLQRERLRAAYERKIQTLVEALIRQHQWKETLRWSEHWIAQGGVPEPAYRGLMRAHLELGDTASAAAAFQRCVAALHEEYGVEPTAETLQVFEWISRGEQQSRPSEGEVPVPSIQDQATALPIFLSDQAKGVHEDLEPFVGRKRELELLDRRLETALSGKGQIAFITGDAGSGKTALMIEFGRRAHDRHEAVLVAAGECNALTGTGDPYLPFREVLATLSGDIEHKWSQGSLTTAQARRLWESVPLSAQVLLGRGEDLLRGFAVLPALQATAEIHKGVDRSVRAGLQRLSERQGDAGSASEQRQLGLFEQYAGVLEGIARHKPLILMVDDMQWSDLGSIDLLFHLGRRIGDSRIMLVGAFRSSEVALGREGKVHPLTKVMAEFKRMHGEVQIDLAEGATENGRAFIDALLDTRPNTLDEPFRAALHAQTGGNPLFALELLRSLENRGDLVQDPSERWTANPSLNWNRWPARIEGVVAERLGRVEDELREILSVASVEGETFTAEAVAQVLKREPLAVVDDLSHGLDRRHRLVLAMGSQRIGDQRLSLYRFRHSLFQRHLYLNLDVVERSYLHEEIGRVLEELHADQLESMAVPLAWHFGEAGVVDKAAEYLYQAGESARRMSASAEAVAHLTHGLELLGQASDESWRLQHELRFNLSLGASLIAAKGYAAPEVEQVFGRARQLCHQIGDTPQLFPAIWGLWSFYTMRGSHAEAYELAQQLFHLAGDDSGMTLEAHRAMGTTHFYRGSILEAHRHFEQGIEIYDGNAHRAHAYLYGQNPLVSCLSNIALTLWFRGYPDRARQRAEEAVDSAEQANHPLSVAYAMDMAAVLHSSRREPDETLAWADRAISVAAEHGFPLWLAAGRIFKGWALAQQGSQEGLDLLQDGLRSWRANGAELGLPHYLALLADAYGQLGNPEEGLSLIDDALQIAARKGEQIHESELLRLKGDLMQAKGYPLDVVGESHQQAIALAQERRSPSMELRARLSQLQCGEGFSARDMDALSKLYRRFEEGLDTPDLQQTRALLSRQAPPRA